MDTIGRTINAAIGGVREGKFTKDGRRYDVRIRLNPEERLTPEDVNRLTVRTSYGEIIPLPSVVKLETVKTLQTISRVNRQRSISVTANLAPGASQATALAEAERIAREAMPAGYTFNLEGGAKTFEESFQSLWFAFLLGLIVAYMVLASQFNSFIHPLTVLLALPFSLTGALAALHLDRPDAEPVQRHRPHPAHGHREEELDPAGGVRQPAARAGPVVREAMLDGGADPLAPDPDDVVRHPGRGAAAGAGRRRGRGDPPAHGAGHRGRRDRFHPVHPHRGALRLPRAVQPRTAQDPRPEGGRRVVAARAKEFPPFGVGYWRRVGCMIAPPVKFPCPAIIQGGMGVGVSHWRLAKAVSSVGQLGVVSGTGLDQVLARRLQNGDEGGHIRRALEHFPLRALAERVIETYFRPEGRSPDAPYRLVGMQTLEGSRWVQQMCIAANFVEVFLAREGHTHPVGINYLEKIQLPHLPSLYGAMLAGVSVVVMGAGIPLDIPPAIAALANHQPASYPVYVNGATGGQTFRAQFDPADFREAGETLTSLPPPDFLPIVSSVTLATVMKRRATGPMHGFVVEGPLAGGHNAPPRGARSFTPDGQPVYGQRDEVDLAAIRDLGLPFWLAGSYGAPEQLRAARAAGAAGIQVGTAFALCTESGVEPAYRRELIRQALAGQASVFTDPLASPTGFPFKVAQLAGTLSDPSVYAQRPRLCDLGALRELYQRPDGKIGYRCPAEPEAQYVAKGGRLEDTVGRKCLCNALTANIGLGQPRGNGQRELPLITLGDDVAGIGRFCPAGGTDFTAADVVRTLLG
jgi:nitronate monooxygenase